MSTTIIKHKTGTAGGYLIGRKHKNGGIKAIVKDTNQPIEVESEEVIITAPAVKDPQKRLFEGQMMTNRQILSKINQDGGGVAFAEGGTIPGSVRCCGNTYNVGGKIMTDYDIVSSCGCKHADKRQEGGDINSEKEKVLLEDIRKLVTAHKPGDFLEIYKEDPQRYLAFIQEQATGLNQQRTEVNLYEGLTPSLAFKRMVEFVGDESIVLRSIEILPENEKELVRKAWYKKILPIPLRRALLKPKLKDGGSLLIPDIDFLHDVATDLSRRAADYALLPNTVEKVLPATSMEKGGTIELAGPSKYFVDKFIERKTARFTLRKSNTKYQQQIDGLKQAIDEGYIYVEDSPYDENEVFVRPKHKLTDYYFKKGGKTKPGPLLVNPIFWPNVDSVSALNMAQQKGEVLPKHEAKNIVNEWKATAKQIGKNQDNSKKAIVSLFDRTGNWTRPYDDAGYITIHFDIQHRQQTFDDEEFEQDLKNGRRRFFIGGDLLQDFPWNPIVIQDVFSKLGIVVVGILSATPCTTFAISGAQHWPKHDEENPDEVERRYGWWAYKHFESPSAYNQTLVWLTQQYIEMLEPEQFYAMENPVGRLKALMGLPEPALIFNPNNYGDPYTKKTLLWGKFNADLPQANVDPTLGSKIHKLRGDNPDQKNERSETPLGFCYAFFMANHSDEIKRGQIPLFLKGGKAKTKQKSKSFSQYQKANSKEREIIISTFGEDAIEPIESILGDVIDLYPYKSKVRLSRLAAPNLEFLVIGASKVHDNWFYLLGENKMLNGKKYIEVKPQFSLYPVIDEPKKEVNPVVSKKYANAYELNKAIENLLDSKKNNEDFSIEEKEFLKYYSGYGGLEKYGAEGKGLLYEYFTPSLIAEKMWGLAYKYGFTKGEILEPSVGIGEFVKYAPDENKVTGYDINPYSVRICQILYPQATIEQKYFEELFLLNRNTIKSRISSLKKFDLVIGNPPYGEFAGKFAGMGEKDYTRASNYIDYFIFRGLDLLKPNGLLVFIIGAEVASGGKPFLSQQINNCKKEIMQKSDLLDAYRLPNGVFERTDVLTDIIVLRKK